MSPTSPVTVRVRGSHRARVVPERGSVHTVVAYDGPEADPVLAQAEAVARQITDGLRELEGGPVSRWSTGQVRVSAQRPWNESGTQLPLVHQARVEIIAEFDDADALGEWIPRAVGLGAAVEWVDWTLTDERRAEVEREVRQAALRDAVKRARDYADALDLGEPQVVTIADTGLLPEHQQQEVRLMAMKDAGGPGPGLVIEPEDIEVTAEVEAEFVIPRR